VLNQLIRGRATAGALISSCLLAGAALAVPATQTRKLDTWARVPTDPAHRDDGDEMLREYPSPRCSWPG
jgi:hypothetical protein